MNILSAGTKKWPLYRGGCCKGLAVSGVSAVVCKKATDSGTVALYQR